jgi:hypothetical protein
MRCDAAQMTRGIGGAACGTSAFDPGGHTARDARPRGAQVGHLQGRAAGEGMTPQPSTQADRGTIIRGEHP